RLVSDWSSDVCSSDLDEGLPRKWSARGFKRSSGAREQPAPQKIQGPLRGSLAYLSAVAPESMQLRRELSIHVGGEPHGAHRLFRSEERRVGKERRSRG